MEHNRPLLRLISGVGKKGPACFALEAQGKRLVLDLGEGPPPGCLPDVAAIAPADALILSHGHKDHIGGLALLAKLGNPPVYATDIVAGALPAGLTMRTLPVRGTSEILGITVETGRNGHAPGGVWLHFAIGNGFLYTGDYSAESVLYAYDPPTRAAAAALIDCSYGDYQKPLGECWDELATHLGKGPLLLPVPANGRGPEIALELMRHGLRDIFIDDAMQKAMRQLADAAKISLRGDLAQEIERLAQIARPIETPRGVMLAASADGASGATARLLPKFERLGEVAILFTGYINPNTPAERLSKSGRAQTMRWNVHPRVADTVTLVRNVQAQTVVPAFCDRTQLPKLEAALAPARVTMDEIVLI
ncbi:MAG TPA: MBL fold metallo-hydrolase [Xanthobacteraceae bacterium]|jgi:Cft2 family RNA processing exonuclease|nr:MBL fold metallo-hydrolase [Xanthobacteraceae bacterium]